MAVVGDNVLVGGRGQNVGAENAGAAYLISPHTGELVLPIANPEPAFGDGFAGGLGVAGLRDDLVIGAFLDDVYEEFDNVGQVFVFDGNTGEELLRIDNPQPEADSSGITDRFGAAVATTVDKIIVGARLQVVDGVRGAGTVYVFDGKTGDLLLSIPNPEPAFLDEFGGSVAAVRNDILVGTPFDVSRPSDGASAGTAYLFDGITGRLLLKIDNPDTDFGNFGWRVEAAGNDLLISALQDAPDGVTITGSVYVYEGVPPFLLGDTSRNGVVDIEDLNHVRNNFGAIGRGLLGDTNGDKVVNIDDLNNVRNQFGKSVEQSASVPEPPAVVLTLISAVMAIAVFASQRIHTIKGSSSKRNGS